MNEGAGKENYRKGNSLNRPGHSAKTPDSKIKSRRAKGTLFSEPRVSALCDMRFSPRDTGKMEYC